VEEPDQAEQAEDRGAREEAGALGQLRDLRRDLRLRELDLLADEQLRLRGDLGDDLAQALVGAAGWLCAVGSHQSSSPPPVMRFRTCANTNAPANAPSA
jgi:hypothetical protein